MNKTANKFISYRKHADYKLAHRLRHDRIITTPEDFFEQGDLIKIKSLLANDVLQLLQYDFNKYTGISLFKFYFVRKINKKTTDKQYKNSRLVVQDYNNTKKTALLT